MLKLNLAKDASILSDHFSIHINEYNVSRALAAFAAILAAKEEMIEIVGSNCQVFMRRSDRKLSSAEEDGGSLRYSLNKQMLETIVSILSAIVLGEKFRANHIDFERQTQSTAAGLTLDFAEKFYETRAAWER